jgi:hypothetical protein
MMTFMLQLVQNAGAPACRNDAFSGRKVDPSIIFEAPPLRYWFATPSRRNDFRPTSLTPRRRPPGDGDGQFIHLSALEKPRRLRLRLL